VVPDHLNNDFTVIEPVGRPANFWESRV